MTNEYQPKPDDILVVKVMESYNAYCRSHDHPNAFACCSAHLVADTMPLMVGEIVRLREQVMKLKAHNENLEADSEKLAALDAAGVDNWEGYSRAMRIFRGEEEES